MSDVVWTPDEATIEHANATRLVRRAGVAELRRARAPLAGRAGVVLAALRSTTWGSSSRQPWERGARRLARARVDDLVRRRHASRSPHNCVHRWAERAPDARRGRRARRGRLAARRSRFAELSRDVTRLAEQLVGARRRRRRPRRDLPADVAGGRGRLARDRAHRRRPGAGLLRLRRAGGRAAARGERGEGRDHAARVVAPRQAACRCSRSSRRRCASPPSVGARRARAVRARRAARRAARRSRSTPRRRTS